MKVIIEIPKEFEVDFIKNKFEECYGRVLSDLKSSEGIMLCGNYELETLEMFKNAFQSAIILSK